MNSYCFILLLFVAPFASHAQKPEPLTTQVVYSFSHVYDTSLRANPRTDKFQLLIGSTHSHFMRGTNVPQTAAAGLQAQPAGPVQVVTAVPIAMVTDPFSVVIDLFQYPALQKLTEVERIGIKEFSLESKLPVIDWKTGSDTRVILGHTCQQASGVFGGRNYTAWFAVDMPLPYGPWKLNGLPGLILEVSDERQEVVFSAIAINEAAQGQLTDYETNVYIPTTAKALSRAKKAYYENPVAGLQAQLAPGSPAPRLMFRDVSGKSFNGAEAEARMEEKNQAIRKGLFNPLERAQ